MHSLMWYMHRLDWYLWFQCCIVPGYIFNCLQVYNAIKLWKRWKEI